MLRLAGQQHERRPLWQAAGALLCLAIVVHCAVAQEPEPDTDFFPRRPFLSDESVWTEPVVYVPVLPLDLPPVRNAEYLRMQERPYSSEHAHVLHQAPLPRPETPPEPILNPEVLEPIPADQGYYFPEPSCLGCNGGCAGCGGGFGGGCGGCGGCNNCLPCDAKTRAGRFACGLYYALCCPDPCYDPRWTGISNSSFWVESARPVTQFRYRWDMALGMQYPDRSEFVWPTVGTLGPSAVPNSLTMHDLSMYSEIASGGFSIFTDMPYRSWNGDGMGGAGFGDMSVGTKSVLFDCELMIVTFQFKTFIPIGMGFKGLGTQHVSLEPSLLMAINLSPDTSFQAQISEWIPIGALSGGGAVLHGHASLNHVLYRWQPAVPIIGTLEANSWSFQDGTYTTPSLDVVQSSGETYVSAGPGVRVVVCDKIDFGIGTAFSLTDQHWGEQTLRSEFRWRF